MLNGGAGNDVLFGSSGKDALNGGAGNDVLYGRNGNDTLTGGLGDDILYGGAGDDTLSGGLGNDIFVYDSDSGSDVITDYTNDENETDTLRIEGAIISGVGYDTNDKSTFVLFMNNGGQIWLSDVVDKPVRIEDNHGIYNVTYLRTDDTHWTTTLTIGDDFSDSGNSFDASDLTFDCVIDASSMTKNMTITGTTGNNIIHAGQGDDILYGGAGSDTLTGGLGNDIFVYDSGIDVITDYTNDENETDILRIEGATISRIFKSNDRFIINTVVGTGTGQIILDDAIGKPVRIEDNHGSYTVTYLPSNLTITLDDGLNVSNFDARDFGSDNVNVIDASGMTKNMTITGTTGNNIIHAGQGNDNLYGGGGDDYLYGGEGNDTFWYESGRLTIHDYEVGKDTIQLVSADVTKSEVLGNDAVLTLSNGGKITVKNMAGQRMDYIDKAGVSKYINFGIETAETITQQNVIKKFMMSLDEPTTIITDADSAKDALNTAVSYASNGVFASWDGLINKFIDDINYYGATTDEQAEAFLETYCGIILNNADTGAIIGSDAGGAEKTADSIVPESGTIDPVGEATTSTINGLTLYWERSDDGMGDEQHYIGKDDDGNDKYDIADSLNTWWAREGLNLIEESFGLSFEGATVKDIDVKFYNDNKYDSDTLAKVRNSYHTDGLNNGETCELRLQINMNYFNSIDFSDGNNLNGDPGDDSNFYLDRVLAHEFTHAVMAANITGFNYLPHCLREGAAELVHGADDTRTDTIKYYALANHSSDLKIALSAMSKKYTRNYAGGYMLLRYLAKQSVVNYGSVLDSGSSNMVATSNSNSIVSDSIVSAASMLWTDEQPAAVADTGSELASSMASINNALLTPLDSTDANLYGADSLTSGLFSDSNKNQSFLG